MGFQLTRFEVLVEPKHYYKSGERVNCMLIIELNGSLKCKHVFITAIGECHAKFYRQTRDLGTTHFMSIPLNLRDIVKTDIMQNALYRVPFDFILHNAFLPSYKVKNGHVMYYVEAIIDNKLFSDNTYNTKQEFTVKMPSNVVTTHTRDRPVASVRENLLRYYGIKIGTVRLSAHMDKDTYYPGDKIYINFHLANRSTRVVRFWPQVIRKTSFKKEYIYLDSNDLVSANCADACLENNSISDIVSISLPFDCISTIDSSLVEIAYTVKLFVDIQNSIEYFDEIPIFIR
ncbi:uncharacterized protein LOC128951263 [Oppia nitens]|uniref:uncharacterized protein LOC128951263 n=1 Tax=Oppia nitens TaxID=1686743 RepID=UPI0023DB1F3F|nr:uncharacterized protein LOC128951263 [Oppia nitens]